MPASRHRSAIALAGVVLAGCAGSGGATTSSDDSSDVAASAAASTTLVQAAAVDVTFETRTAGIEAENGEGVFFHVLELPSGTIIATGVDASAGDTGAGLIYRSTDGGATFASVPRPDPSEWAIVSALLHRDGITYAFGQGPNDFGLGFVWQSVDDGVTWSSDFVAGVPTAAAVVDSTPLIATIGADGLDLAPRIVQGLVSDAAQASTPDAIGVVLDIAELADGSLLAVGRRSDTDPGHDPETSADEPPSPGDALDRLVWISADRGASWTDLSPIGLPLAQWATVATRLDDRVVVGTVESTPTGDGYTMTLRSTADGVTFDDLVSIPVGGAVGDRPNVDAIEVAGSTVVALVAGSGDSDTTLLVYDAVTGARTVIPSSSIDVRLVTGLTTLGGDVHVIGIDDDARPVLARLIPSR